MKEKASLLFAIVISEPSLGFLTSSGTLHDVLCSSKVYCEFRRTKQLT